MGILLLSLLGLLTESLLVLHRHDTATEEGFRHLENHDTNFTTYLKMWFLHIGSHMSTVTYIHNCMHI